MQGQKRAAANARPPSLRHDIAFAHKKRTRGEESGKLRARRKRHGADRRGRFEGLPAGLLRDGRVSGFPRRLPTRPRLSVRADWSCAASHSGSASTQRSRASMPPKPASNMKGWAVSKSLFKQWRLLLPARKLDVNLIGWILKALLRIQDRNLAQFADISVCILSAMSSIPKTFCSLASSMTDASTWGTIRAMVSNCSHSVSAPMSSSSRRQLTAIFSTCFFFNIPNLFSPPMDKAVRGGFRAEGTSERYGAIEATS